MICPICSTQTDHKKILAFDRPRMNLYVCVDCHRKAYEDAETMKKVEYTIKNGIINNRSTRKKDKRRANG